MQQYLQPSRATTPPLYLGNNHQQSSAGQQQQRMLPTPAIRGFSQPPQQQPQPQQHQLNAESLSAAPTTVPLRIPDFETAYRSRPSSPVMIQQQQLQQQQYAGITHNHGIPPGTGSIHAPLWSACNHNGSAPQQRCSYSAQPEQSHPPQQWTEAPSSTGAHQEGRLPSQRQDSATMHHTHHQQKYTADTQPPPLAPSSYFEHPTSAQPPQGHHQAAYDAMRHYQSRMDQERAHTSQLDQEEAKIAAEEANLRMRLMELDGERRASEASHHAIHAGWSEVFASEEWFHATPYLDLSAEAAAVQFRCDALNQQLEALSHTLQGHEMELKRYDGNDAVRNRQLASMEMLEECCTKMERRRQMLRATCERHFDAETQRERAARRHVAEVESSIERLKQATGGSRRDTASVPTGAVGMSGRAGSVSSTALSAAAQQQQQQQQRQRLVSFRSASQTEDRPPALQAGPAIGSSGGPSTYPHHSGVSGIDGGGSFCIGLDEDSTAGDMFGLNGNSIAFSLCDTKRHRSEAISAM